MNISKGMQQEIIILLQQGFSANSICEVMKKKHKNVNLKSSDIIILAKKNNIKMGNKDITKEKIDLKSVKNMMPQMLDNKDMMKEVKGKIALIVVCLFALLGVVGFLTDWMVALYIFIGLIVIFAFAVGVSYFKFVKPNKAKLAHRKKK